MATRRRSAPKSSAAPAPPAHADPSRAFDCVALVLQGGGALGAYQAGVYQALDEAGVALDWVAGISIGAINAAIIAGNAPGERVRQLRGFWEQITSNPFLDWTLLSEHTAPQGDLARGAFNQFSAAIAAMQGAKGFFRPRTVPPLAQPPGTPAATSFYDTAQLSQTLRTFVDFDRINRRETRLSVGAVNVRNGNFVYFENSEGRPLGPEHVIASGSLPPGFAYTEVDGDYYWDGGLISNTPLQWVVDAKVRQDTLAFQVDLWSADGQLPTNLVDVVTRQKEIQYSSRTRAGTTQFKRMQRVRHALADLLERLPADICQGEDYELLKEVADHKVYNVVHLIYRSRAYETHSKDYEFSRLTMQDHWTAGYVDMLNTLKEPAIFRRPRNREGVQIFDHLRTQR